MRVERGNSCWCCFHHMRGSVSLATCCTRMYAFKLVSPLTEDGSTCIDVVLTPKRSSKTLGLGTCPSTWLTSPWVGSILKLSNSIERNVWPSSFLVRRSIGCHTWQCPVGLWEPIHLCTWGTRRGGTGRVWVQKRHLCCHIHLDTSVSRSLVTSAGLGYENRYTCVHVWVRRGETGNLCVQKLHLCCHIHLGTSISQQVYYSE